MRAAQQQLSPDICGSKVVLFLGAGASAALGLKLMGSFMDLLEETMGDIALRGVLGKMCAERGKDLEVLFETIEKYEMQAEWCRSEPNWRRVADTQEFGSLMGDARQIKKLASDLLVVHYGAVDRGAAAPLYLDFLALLVHSNTPRHLPIFTTNYDIVIEDFVDGARGLFHLVDGFTTGSRRTWSPDTTFGIYRAEPSGENALLLFKLHGSCAWRLDRQTNLYTKESSSEPVSQGSRYENALVWPALTKTVREGPYETNYAYLRGCLQVAELCVVIGFSFRDEVIKSYFVHAMAANPSLQLAVIDPRAAPLGKNTLGLPGDSRFHPIVSKFGTEHLPTIGFELAKLDFAWEPGTLAALTAQPE